jgi:hypothetical protein
MSSAVNSLSSLSPLSLSVPAATTAPSLTTTSETDGVTAQQELSAMEKNGSLDSVLSDSVAVGVLQIMNPGPEPATGQTGISNLVNQLLSAYQSSSSTSSSSSSSSPSTNPGLALIQDMEADGSFSTVG